MKTKTLDWKEHDFGGVPTEELYCGTTRIGYFWETLDIKGTLSASTIFSGVAILPHLDKKCAREYVEKQFQDFINSISA